MNICSAEDLCLNGAITSGSERYQGQWSLGEAVQLELLTGILYLVREGGVLNDLERVFLSATPKLPPRR